MPKITSISKFAKRKGFKIGDDIVKIGGYPCVDILDVLYFDNEKNFDVTVYRDGKIKTLKIRKKETKGTSQSTRYKNIAKGNEDGKFLGL